MDCHYILFCQPHLLPCLLWDRVDEPSWAALWALLAARRTSLLYQSGSTYEFRLLNECSSAVEPGGVATFFLLLFKILPQISNLHKSLSLLRECHRWIGVEYPSWDRPCWLFSSQMPFELIRTKINTRIFCPECFRHDWSLTTTNGYFVIWLLQVRRIKNGYCQLKTL